MEFSEMKEIMQKHISEIIKNETHLFELQVDNDEFWNLYLDSFPEGTNEIVNERREFDCNACKYFIKHFGNVVVLKNNQIKTIWDFEIADNKYQIVFSALSNYLKDKAIKNVYVTNNKSVGTNLDYKHTENAVITYEHFYFELPRQFVNKNNNIGEIRGHHRDVRNVFKRSLDEITEESILTILELVSQKSLYKGEEWESVLKAFLKHHKAYYNLKTEREKEIYTWEYSVKVGDVIGKIRNHSIGVLLTNVSEDMDLNDAVKKYEAIVAPSNYKRPKEIFSKKMLEEAQKKIEEMGYIDSLERRYAIIDDLTVNNILFSNKDVAKRIKGGSIFDDLAQDITTAPKKFDKTEEIEIDTFIEKVLPTAVELEVYFDNKHSENLVSLIAPKNKDSKTMFKWNNCFSWAYTGNITDSNIKENVKNAGGKIDGVLRFSIQWNDESDWNKNDFDAHCILPNGNEICYLTKYDHSCTLGQLDVDIRHTLIDVPAVENITWPDKNKLIEGTYSFYVHNYANRGGRSGFKAEIEFDGQIYNFSYNKELKLDERIDVADVQYSINTGFSIKERIQYTASSKELWNLKTNQFVPVYVVSYSPNYWDKQRGIGHKHYFFMLKNCINSENPSGFFNEFINQELLNHKQVIAALGSKMRVKSSNDQLSGLGFSSTKRNDLIVKVKGHTERLLKIKF